MLVTNHVLSGALIGYAVRRSTAAFAVGVVSHLVLDSVPHWGAVPLEEVMGVAVTDGLVGLGVIAAVSAATPRPLRLPVMAGMAGAALLDLDKPSRVFFGFSPFPRPVDAFHSWVQRESRRRMPQEILVGLGGSLSVAALARRARRGLRTAAR